MAQRLKHLPPMRETWVRSLGREDPLEKEMVTHSNILAWRIPWTEKPGRLQSMGSQRKCELSTLVIQRPPAKEGTSEVFRTGPTLCRGLLSILLDRSRTLEIPTWNRKLSPTPTASLVTWQVKNPPSNAGDTRDMGLVLGSRRSPWEGNGNPLQYSCLENSHGQRSLAGSPWVHKESDTTEHAHTHTPGTRWLEVSFFLFCFVFVFNADYISCMLTLKKVVGCSLWSDLNKI